MIPAKLLAVLIECLAVVESDNRPDAVAPDYDHRGLLQIGTAMREDLNRIAGREKWKDGDQLNPAKAKVMALEYFDEYAESWMNPYALALMWRMGKAGMLYGNPTEEMQEYAKKVADGVAIRLKESSGSKDGRAL